jgi:prepilin-type N-terminal cleavage/methylation domain-containing protein
MRSRKQTKSNGFSVPELLIVLLVIAIIAVLALPQVISSRRLFRFSATQRQVATGFREARQEAMSQRTAVTIRYDNLNKTLSLYGGNFGVSGDSKNRIYLLTGDGLESDNLVYGRPTGVTVAALGDGTTLTSLASNAVEVTYQTDGSVVDASNNPQNKALFFYNPQIPEDTAFAVSILGAGGRAKLWKYSSGVNAYVE